MKRPRVPSALWSQLGPVPVRVVERCVDSDGEPCDGTMDWSARVIEVDASLSPAMQAQRALHEVVHCWLLDAEIRLGRREESVCQAIANGVYNLLHATVPRKRRAPPPP